VGGRAIPSRIINMVCASIERLRDVGLDILAGTTIGDPVFNLSVRDNLIKWTHTPAANAW
jgi:hypothetical protein